MSIQIFASLWSPLKNSRHAGSVVKRWMEWANGIILMCRGRVETRGQIMKGKLMNDEGERLTMTEIHWKCVLKVLPQTGSSSCPFFLFSAPGGLWVGAIHPALCGVPDALRHPQRQHWQDESVGAEVLRKGAEEPGSILWGMGVACPEGSGNQPGPSAQVAGKPHAGIYASLGGRDVQQGGGGRGS